MFPGLVEMCSGSYVLIFASLCDYSMYYDSVRMLEESRISPFHAPGCRMPHALIILSKFVLVAAVGELRQNGYI